VQRISSGILRTAPRPIPAPAGRSRPKRALRGLIRAWHAAREQGLPAVPAEIREPIELEFRRAVTVGLSAVPRVPGPKTAVKQKPGREMLEFCRAREADVLRFASDTSVWPTNNLSERGVRPLKTQQMISGRLTSDDVTQNRLDIRGYIDTARKHGLGALDVLEQHARPPLDASGPAHLAVKQNNPRHHHTQSPG